MTGPSVNVYTPKHPFNHTEGFDTDEYVTGPYKTTKKVDTLSGCRVGCTI